MLADLVPHVWRTPLRAALDDPSFAALSAVVDAERARAIVYPPAAHTFAALAATPPDRVRVVVVGQDPYHGEGQAHGLAFSVPRGAKKPPSLANILKELHDDVGCPVPAHGALDAWAARGVLLLNTVLTVRDGEPFSHKGKGWEAFTDAVLRAVDAGPRGVVFVLWGAHAQKKRALVDETRHAVLCCVHPSPLSASKGFFGSKPFSRVNGLLIRAGREPIDWCLPL